MLASRKNELLERNAKAEGRDRMDGKLARGFTRDGFRREMKAAGATADLLSETTTKLAQKLRSRGKLSKDDCISALSQIHALKDDPLTTVFHEVFISPDTSKLSSNFDSAIVGGYFYPETISFFKNEESIRRYGLFYDRYSRKKIDIRTLGRPLYIREHAIKRLLERANATYVSVTRSLWPGLLVTEALHYFSELAVARPFAIPTTDGMFLCIAAMGKPNLDDTGFTRMIVTRSGHQLETTPCMEPLVSTYLVNTFVSLSEMAPDQCYLRSALMELIERHRSVLTVAHLARVMNVDGNEDGLGLEAKFFGDPNAARDDFGKVFEGALWRQAIRTPSDTPFTEHFVAQAMLERSAKTDLQ